MERGLVTMGGEEGGERGPPEGGCRERAQSREHANHKSNSEETKSRRDRNPDFTTHASPAFSRSLPAPGIPLQSLLAKPPLPHTPPRGIGASPMKRTPTTPRTPKALS